MLKAGIIGFGSISKAHRNGYANLEKLGKVQLTCAYDINPEAFQKVVKNNLDDPVAELDEHIHFYTDLDEMLANEEIDFVDLCIPTFLHSKLSIELLERGYHVLCEKPMSLTYTDCVKMIEAAEKAQKELMIGQCLRFFPAFESVKKILDEKRYGKVLGAFFSRLSASPKWSWENWFADPNRSGGAVTDLHIHDIDIIRYLFGEPEAVSSRASSSFSVHDTVHTALFYEDFPVTAIADWTREGLPFSDESSIDLEKATLCIHSSGVTVYHKDGGEAEKLPIEDGNGYQGEIAYFCDVVTGKTKNTRNPASSAATSIRLIEGIRQSIEAKGQVVPFSAN